MSLSDAACRAAKPATGIQKLSDGFGLQLWVQPNGSKLWRLAYRFRGKQKLLSLGPYPTVSLSDARDERDKAKKLLVKGIDPSDARKNAKADALATAATFRLIAEELLDLQSRSGRAEVTVEKTKWLLEFAYPTLGDKRITDIRSPEVLTILRNVERLGHYETARRLRSTIGRVFRLAVATGRADNDPTYALHGTLARPPAKPHAAITDAKAFGALLRAIDGFDGQRTTLYGLKLMALLFPRPGELRAAEWSEFDTEKNVWTIPASRTKLRRQRSVHAVSSGKAQFGSSIPISANLFPPNDATVIVRNLRGTSVWVGVGGSERRPHARSRCPIASTQFRDPALWPRDIARRARARRRVCG